jgi:hypothetical protein
VLNGKHGIDFLCFQMTHYFAVCYQKKQPSALSFQRLLKKYNEISRLLLWLAYCCLIGLCVPRCIALRNTFAFKAKLIEIYGECDG